MKLYILCFLITRPITPRGGRGGWRLFKEGRGALLQILGDRMGAYSKVALIPGGVANLKIYGI